MLSLNYSANTVSLVQEEVQKVFVKMQMNYAAKAIMDYLKGLAAMSDAELDALEAEHNGDWFEVEANINKAFAYKYANKKQLVISIARAAYEDDKQEFRRLVAEL